MTSKKNHWFIALGIIVLLLVSLACASSTDQTGKKVGEADSANAPVANSESTQDSETKVEPTEAPETKVEPTKAPDFYNVGDIIELKDQRITLNGGEYKGNVLKVNFTIENTGSSDLNLSSIISFSAKDSEGTKLEQEIFDCGSQFDGKVLPGDKVRGDLCYKLASPGAVKIYYEASLFGSGAVVWQLDTNSLTGIPQPPADSGTSTSNVKTYVVGDVIELQGQKITLNEATITGNVLKANFTIENTGTEDLNVSSMISFNAKTSDGTKLEQNFFDCGSAQVDGKVLPNDKVKGDICWNTGGATPIKIYYEASLFGSGAVVWEVK